jgi:hypothetical protein
MNSNSNDCDIAAERMASEEFLESVQSVIESDNIPKTYKCLVCNRAFKKETLYNEHLLTQTCISDNHRTNCIRCRIFFDTRTDLAAHILTPEHRVGITNYIKKTIEEKQKRAQGKSNISVSGKTNSEETKKKRILNKLDILNSVDSALSDEEKQQIRNIVENSSSIKSKSVTAVPIPTIPDNTIKIIYSNGHQEIFEGVKLSVNNKSYILTDLPKTSVAPVAPIAPIVDPIAENVSKPFQRIQASPIQVVGDISPSLMETATVPSPYQKKVLQFLKLNAENPDRKGAFFKLLMKSQAKHEDAFVGFVKMVNRMSSISAEAKADYIAALADFEAFLIGLASRGQPKYNDMDIFHVVSLINSSGSSQSISV